MAKRRPAAPNGITKPHRVTRRTPTQPPRRSQRLEQLHEKSAQQSTHTSQRRQLPSPESSPKEVGIEDCVTRPREAAIDGRQTPTRKRKLNTEEQTCEPPQKRSRHSDAAISPERTRPCHAKETYNPVEYWAEHQVWPPAFAKMDYESSSKGSKKRPISTSYAQSVRDGESPRPHSQAHEKAMIDCGMIMNILQDEAAIDDDSKELCVKMFDAIYDHPNDSLFQDNTFLTVLRRVQTRNEARVVRDLTPCLVPSAELLYICFNTKLEHLIEELNELWDKCNPIYGPRMKPDFAVGLASSAFTAEEIQHLKMNHTGDSPSYVTADMYFPFLICEAKCSKKSVSEAERQAMQSSSIAVKAVVELYRKVSRAYELDRKILAFSICHDHQTVQIYGHYACTTGAVARYFRHRLNSIDFTIFGGKDRWTAYDFTRSVYDLFVPEHVKRIRSVLTELQKRPPEPSMSVITIDGGAQKPGSQEVSRSAESSQGAGGFKKPSLPSNSMSQGGDSRLHDQISMLLRQQQEQQRQQQEQLDQLRRESKEQLEQQKKESKEQLEQQKKESKEQLEQLRDIIALLKQSRT